MRDGIISGLIPAQFPYADPIQRAAELHNVSAFVVYSIGEQETINGEQSGWLVAAYGPGTTAANVVSNDGGHGIFQLTSSYPQLWQDPYTNAEFACANFIAPAWEFWSGQPYNLVGDALVRAVAAEFNAGRGLALAGHLNHSNVGIWTTKTDGIQYDLMVLQNYHRFLKLGH